MVTLVAVRGLLADQVGLGALGTACLLALRVLPVLLLSTLDVCGARVVVLEVLLAMPHCL